MGMSQRGVNPVKKLILLLMFIVVSSVPLTYAQESDCIPITASNMEQVEHLKTMGIGDITSMIWSPDGSHIAIEDDEGFWIYEVKNWQAAPRFIKWDNPYEDNQIRFSPDSMELWALVSNVYLDNQDHRVTLQRWDVQSGERLAPRILGGDVLTVGLEFNRDQSISPDGQVIVTVLAEQNELTFWDTASGIQISTLPAWRSQYLLNNNLILRGQGDTPNEVWNFRTGERISVLEDMTLWFQSTNAQLSFDQNTIAAFQAVPSTVEPGTYHENITFWDMNTGQIIDKIDPIPFVARTFALSPNTNEIIVGGAGAGDGGPHLTPLWFWDITSMALRTRTAEMPPVYELAFSPEGQYVISGSAGGNVIFWDVATATQLLILPTGNRLVNAAAFHPDGHLLATGGIGTALWDLETGQQLSFFDGGQDYGEYIESLTFSYDGKFLITALGEVWDTTTNTLLYRLDEQPYAAVMAAPDNTVWAIRYSGWEQWNISNREVISTYEQNLQVETAVLNQATRLIAILGSGIQLRDMDTGEIRYRIPTTVSNISDVAFQPNGNYIAQADANHLRIWETESGAEIYIQAARFSAAEFSPDGTVLAAAGGQNNRIILLNWQQNLVVELNSNQHQWRTMAFSSDGCLLVTSGSYGSTIYIWGIPEQQE